MRSWVLAATAAAAVTTVAIWHARPHAPKSHAPRHEDERRRGPGIHRASSAELALRDRVAREESAKIAAKRAARGTAAAALPSVPATTWVNIGPTDAPEEINYYKIDGVDSGRPNSIVVDPRDPNVVYVAVSGGGIWKTYDFLGPQTHWNPAFDTQPNLAVGALAIDPTRPDTLYAGLGDFVDGSGDTVQTTHDGGSTWSDPVRLVGTHADGTPAQVGAVRAIGVQAGTVLVATDAGMFASTDDGVSFALLDLPNASDLKLSEAIWSVVPTGGTSWVATGMPACDLGAAPPGLFGFDPGTYCKYGNDTMIWQSDDGVAWTIASIPATTGVGRATLAAGASTDPTTTVVYAFVGTGFGDRTAGFWRSGDAGHTWADASGTLSNPTVSYDNMGMQTQDCGSIDVGHNQSWYNQAIVVDPTNPDHVLVGGNLCAMRTLNGSAASPTWELVSYWLPNPDSGATTTGDVLPYVHADWHTATSVYIADTLYTLAGTDGGVFTSYNVFDSRVTGERVNWSGNNRGLATHLMYSVASGDPATGNPFLLYAGLQDNGTRFRSDPHHPSYFNQPIGGDGIGATVHSSASGTTLWASVEYERVYCKPAEADCSTEVPSEMDPTLLHWHFLAPAVPAAHGEDGDDIAERVSDRLHAIGEDTEPFLIHYSNVETDTTGDSVLTHSDGQVFVSVADGSGSFTWSSISQDLSTSNNGLGFANVVASRGTADLYGGVGTTSAAPFYFTTQGNSQRTWTVTQPVKPMGPVLRMLGPSSMDFPTVLPAGTQPGQVFIGAFTGVLRDSQGNPVMPPDDKGRLYRTSDYGQTWTSIVGADPAHRLPNVPIYVVKYDPVTPTTIYAGTDVGVYLTLDDGVTWDRMGEGFPVVAVRDLYVAKNQEFIRAATYGRGLWEIYPSSGAAPGAPGNGDYDRNLKIDWVDVAAMASRLGDTPGTTTAPFYSWIMDMTGGTSDPPLAAIDDADLTALLELFGGHP
jgi:hypothetical protein